MPDSWIEKIFQRLEDFYGSKWAAQYGDFPRDRVKNTWAEELAGFADQPDRIAYALKAMTQEPFPPTLPEFMAACRRAPTKSNVLKALPVYPTKEDKARADKMISDALAVLKRVPCAE